MPKLLSAFLIGAIFGLGIAVSGMINPAKVLNFFDIAGSWDPSLAFVMGGGLAVTAIGYRIIFRVRARPLFEETFSSPVFLQIDQRLLAGAALFGIGWGIVGFCPGGAIPALALGYTETAVFLAAMIGGIVAARALTTRLASKSPT
jgi:uncharacterized membrane protein YedE/YeeE